MAYSMSTCYIFLLVLRWSTVIKRKVFWHLSSTVPVYPSLMMLLWFSFSAAVTYGTSARELCATAGAKNLWLHRVLVTCFSICSRLLPLKVVPNPCLFISSAWAPMPCSSHIRESRFSLGLICYPISPRDTPPVLHIDPRTST